MKRHFPCFFACIFFALFFASCPGIDPASKAGTNSTGVFAHQDETPGTLIESVYKAADDLAAALPQGTIIAVINIASAEQGEGDLAEEQLIFCLVQMGKFRVVERRDLDAIRREQNFHLSGEVDDETAVSIGHIAGAGIVITGTVLPYGENKFLNTRALDVESAQIKAVSSRLFASLF